MTSSQYFTRNEGPLSATDYGQSHMTAVTHLKKCKDEIFCNVGYGKPLALNPVVGLFLSGASIFFPLRHVLIVRLRYVVVAE